MRHTRQFLALLASGALALTLAATPAQAKPAPGPGPGPAPAPITLTITSTSFDGPRVVDGMNGCWLTIRATLSAPVPTSRYGVEYWARVEWPATKYYSFSHVETVGVGQTQLVSNPNMMGFCGTDGAKVVGVGARLFTGRTTVTQATKVIDPPYVCVVR